MDQGPGWIRQEGALFDFRQKDSCLLLIIDRKEDPLTPILARMGRNEKGVFDVVGFFGSKIIPNVISLHRHQAQIT